MNKYTLNRRVELLHRIYDEILEVVGVVDTGSCVLGMSLEYKGEAVCGQPCQGNMGCYDVYQRVIDIGATLGYNRDDFHVIHGNMD